MRAGGSGSRVGPDRRGILGDHGVVRRLSLFARAGAVVVAAAATGLAVAVHATAAPQVVATIPLTHGVSDVGVNPATHRLFVVNSTDDTFSVIDTTTNAVLTTRPMTDGPVVLDVNTATNRVYVAHQFTGNAVSVIDGASSTVVATVPVSNPWGPAVDETRNRIYVSLTFGGGVAVMDGTTNAVLETIPTSGTSTLGIAVDESRNLIYAVDRFANLVDVIDGTTDTVVDTVTLGSAPQEVAVDAVANEIYVTNQNDGTVSVIDGATRTVEATIPVGSSPRGVAVDSVRHRVYVTNQSDDSVSVIDGVTKTVIASPAVGTLPFQVDVDESTGRAYVANYGDGSVSVIDEAVDEALAITDVTELTGTVGRYDRFEASIDLSATFANPFDPDQIAVDVTFTSPSGRTQVVPAFWYEPFTASGTDWETYTPAGTPKWRVRFAPEEVGTYTYSVAAVASTTTASPVGGSFEVAPSSSDGFVRTDDIDGRYLRFDDGEPYVPVGHNLAFEDSNPALNGVGFYANQLGSLERAGENWSRVWMTDFNRSALEWGEGHYSGFYHGPGTYSLPSAWRMDRILELAEQDGVYIQLVLNDFGQFSTRGGDRWGVRCAAEDVPPCEPGDPGYDPGNAYSDANGGPVPVAQPELAFSNADARDLMKQRLRYVVARWGAFRSVLAWELMNEMQFVGSDAANPYTSAQVRSDLVSWHADLSGYLKATDPFGHLVTTSAAIKDSDGALTQLNDVWALPSVDLVQIHWYEPPSGATTTALSAWVDELRGRYGKPVLVGELGLPAPNPEPNFDPATFSGTVADREHLVEGTHLHNTMWSTAVSASGSMYWWWGNYIAADPGRNRTTPGFPLNERLVPPLRDFLAGEDWAPLGLTQADVTTSGPVVAVGSSSGDRAYVWARDAENEYGSGSRPGDLAGRSVTGASLTLPMDDGAYEVRIFDTWGNGGVTATLTPVATGGSLTVALPSFTRDVALRIERVGDVPAGPCADAPDRSPSGPSPPVVLTFVNDSDGPVQVYWLTYDGNRDLRFTLGPGQRLDQGTFASHVWLVVDAATGECLDWASGSDGELHVGGSSEPPPADTDGDGLYDVWETDGIDVNDDGTVDLPLQEAPYNADPQHKDVFLEVDSMAPNAPQTGTLGDVVAAFAASPVSNPDGTTGVRLHAMAGDQVPTYATVCFWDCAGFPAPVSYDELKNGDPDSLCDGFFGTAAERTGANCAPALEARRLVFRYALFAANYSERPGSSGVGELWGNDLMVTLGSAYSSWIAATGNLRAAEAGTLMHELGHTLDLGHGGGDPVNCKPNYQSVMTYTRQVPNVDLTRPLDYSDTQLADLDETSLDESLGIEGPAGTTVIWGVGGIARVAAADGEVDWDGNGSIDEDAVADINHVAAIGDCAGSPGQLLHGHDDWSSLRYGFRASPNFGEGSDDPPRQPPVAELTAAAALETAKTTDSDGDGATNASEAVCAVTREYVQGSAQWRNAKPAQRAPATALLATACGAVEAITPTTQPAVKNARITAYNAALTALRAGGWLTEGQVATLRSIAATL